jgi:hypothetical protein
MITNGGHRVRSRRCSTAYGSPPTTTRGGLRFPRRRSGSGPTQGRCLIEAWDDPSIVPIGSCQALTTSEAISTPVASAMAVTAVANVSSLARPGRLAKSGDLTHVLQSGGLHLRSTEQLRPLTQRNDASTHGCTVGLPLHGAVQSPPTAIAPVRRGSATWKSPASGSYMARPTPPKYIDRSRKRRKRKPSCSSS